MVGAAVCRRLENEATLLTRTRSELDLTDRPAVHAYLAETKPDAIVLAAAKVGGIQANSTFPVEFLTENLQIATNVIGGAHAAGVPRVLFLGSTCIYPREAPQPIPEDALLSGPLEKTNEAYALAKISGLKLCQYYRQQYGVLYHSVMPTNLYGPGDNYHPEHSHVLPALVRRFHEAREQNLPHVTIWGTGSPQREFLYVDDLADAIVHILGIEDPPDWVNVGTGEDLPILDLAKLVAKTVGFEGEIRTDPSKPDGTPRKVTDVTRLHGTGWKHKISLEEGLRTTYAAFLEETSAGLLRQR